VSGAKSPARGLVVRGRVEPPTFRFSSAYISLANPLIIGRVRSRIPRATSCQSRGAGATVRHERPYRAATPVTVRTCHRRCGWPVSRPARRSWPSWSTTRTRRCTFVHWVAWGIDRSTAALEQGTTPHCTGTNGFGRRGYGGPCPPRGAPHWYTFTVFALSRRLDLPPGASADHSRCCGTSPGVESWMPAWWAGPQSGSASGSPLVTRGRCSGILNAMSRYRPPAACGRLGGSGGSSWARTGESRLSSPCAGC
jgi:Phosphatidylethanolamine-binding protein